MAQTEPTGQSRLRVWVERVYELDDRLYHYLDHSPTAHLVTFAVLWALVLTIAICAAVTRPRLLIAISPELVAAIILVPVVRKRYRQKLMERRRKAGQCLVCGYDLRETPDRCPECGTPIPKAST